MSPGCGRRFRFLTDLTVLFFFAIGEGRFYDLPCLFLTLLSTPFHISGHRLVTVAALIRAARVSKRFPDTLANLPVRCSQ
jgi:hypothetical protein